jgi:hypothetical protein
VAGGCHSGPVTSSVDLSPPRRPIFFPVVIATVFLTIIGMSGGFVLGQRHRQSLQVAPPPSQPATASATPTIDGTACPEPAQQAAANAGSSSLRQVLMIETKDSNTVWICEDPAGHLFYQSHTLIKGQDLPLSENYNGLFLTGVIRSGDGYQVFDQKGNQFEISKKSLHILFASGKTQESNVVRWQ